MQVKHLLLLVALILLIPPGFYWLMSSSSSSKTPKPFTYDAIKTAPETISIKIHDDESLPIGTPYYDTFVEKLKATPSWLVQDANFQSCVTKAITNCEANTTQREAQLLQSDTLCDALPADKAAICKNQFHYTKAIKNKDISLCIKITNSFQKRACQNGVFTQKALESRDSRWCDKLSSSTGNTSASGLISPEKQNCLNLLDLQKGTADASFLNTDWEAGELQETVLD